MKIRNQLVTAIFAPAAIAAAVITAPIAGAQATSGCGISGPGTECVTPGNAQLNDSLPPSFLPEYPEFSFFGFEHQVGGWHR